MLRIKKLFSIFVIAGFLSSAFSQEAKNALLIANGDYSEIKSLSQPVPEGEELKAALESIGFSVMFVKNANRNEMFASLREFKSKVEKEGGISFFHYGGHAVQIREENYLIPVNEKITDEEQIPDSSVELNRVMDFMVGESNVVVLDSCRNDPFPNGRHRGGDSRGLAAVSRKPKNSIIVYSAEAGETAQDGVYTPALTKRITEKGKSIEEVLKEVRNDVLRATAGQQLPGEYRQLVSDVYLAGRSSSLVKQTGSIIVTSDIEGDLYLDSDFKCHIRENGPQKIEDLQSGKYYLEIRSGEKKFFENILVEADKTIDVFIKSGGINLLSNVSGEVYLNGKRFGYVEAEKELELSQLGSEIYKVEVKSADGFVFTKNAEVRTGEKTSVNIQACEVSVIVNNPGIFFINGKKMGTISETQIFMLPIGDYKTIFMLGKQKKEENFTLEEGSSKVFEYKSAKVSVKSKIKGKVYVDNEYWEPIENSDFHTLSYPLLSEKKYLIKVKDGKKENWEYLEVEDDENYTISLDKYKNNSIFAVDDYGWGGNKSMDGGACFGYYMNNFQFSNSSIESFFPPNAFGFEISAYLTCVRVFGFEYTFSLYKDFLNNCEYSSFEMDIFFCPLNFNRFALYVGAGMDFGDSFNLNMNIPVFCKAEYRVLRNLSIYARYKLKFQVIGEESVSANNISLGVVFHGGFLEE